MIEPKSFENPKLKELIRVLMDWINDELHTERIIVQVGVPSDRPIHQSDRPNRADKCTGILRVGHLSTCRKIKIGGWVWGPFDEMLSSILEPPYVTQQLLIEAHGNNISVVTLLTFAQIWLSNRISKNICTTVRCCRS